MLMYSGPARADATLAELDELGVDRVRVSLHWANVAPERRADLKDPTDPGAYDASEFDAIDHLVRQVQRHGISVLLTVTGPAPAWAGASAAPTASAYSQFVEMVGKRWSGSYRDSNQGRGVLPRVSAWTLWNEPNWHNQLMPQWVGLKGGGRRAYVPRLYRSLYRAAVAGLERSGHGGDTILLGDTAPLGSKGKNEQVADAARDLPARAVLPARRRPLDDRRQLPAARVRLPQARPAARRRATRTIRTRSARPPGATGRDPLGHRAGRLAPGSGRSSTRPRRAGRLPARLPFWFTEFGYQTRPPDPLTGVSLATRPPSSTQAEKHDLGRPARRRARRSSCCATTSRAASSRRAIAAAGSPSSPGCASPTAAPSPPTRPTGCRSTRRRRSRRTRPSSCGGWCARRRRRDAAGDASSGARTRTPRGRRSARSRPPTRRATSPPR